MASFPPHIDSVSHFGIETFVLVSTIAAAVLSEARDQARVSILLVMEEAAEVPACVSGLLPMEVGRS